MRNIFLTSLAALSLLTSVGCGALAPGALTERFAGGDAAGTSSKPSPTSLAAAPPAYIGAGSRVSIRLAQSLSTDRNRSGDHFEGTLDSPIELNGKVVIPRGAAVTGFVNESKPSGRFKGHAVLSLSLRTIEIAGKQVPIKTAMVGRASKGHRNQNVAWVGGGAGTGAIIGAIAGGGQGAAFGAGAGAAGGLTGALLTGKKQIRIPAEALISFRLSEPIPLIR